MKTIFANSQRYQVEFDSISEYAQHIENLGNQRDGGARTISECASSEDWDLGHNLNDAIDAGKQGGYWPEGAAALQAVDVSDCFDAKEYIVQPDIELGVIGGGIDTGEYLAGAPECFLQLVDSEPQQKIIVLDVLAVPASTIRAKSMYNYGRAILAVVEALEASNYSVELRATYCGGTGNTNHIEASIVIKQAGEAWAPSTVAYALAHPAFSRRLGFRLTESAPNGIGDWASNHHYGSGNYLDQWNGSQGADIAFGYQTEDSHLRTPAKALRHVMRMAHAQQPDLIKST